MNDSKEKLFIRAMLRRLNVLFAKARPKGGLIEVLGDSKLSDAYDGSQKVGEKVKQKVVHFSLIPPKALPDEIAEQSMQPPEIVAEIRGG